MLKLSSDNAVHNSFWQVLANIRRLVAMLLHCPLNELVCRWQHFGKCLDKNFVILFGKGVYIIPILDNWATTITSTPIKLQLKSVRMPSSLIRRYVISNITRPPATRYDLTRWTKYNFWVNNWLQIGSSKLRIVTSPNCFWVTSLDLAL